MKSPILKRRQELSKAYCLNGSIYLANRNFLIEKNSFIDEKFFRICYEHRSIDIDNNYDWEVADVIYEKFMNKILVTGADGFIGSHLVEKLVMNGECKSFLYV